MIKIGCTIILLLLGTTLLLAQKTKAEKIYEARGYGVYLELLHKKDLTALDEQTLLKLATSSRKVGDSYHAERLYKRLVELDNPDPLWHLYYAQALQTNGQYLAARNQFKISDEKLAQAARGKDYDQRARLGWETCNKITQMRSLGTIAITSAQMLNSPRLDFSPVFYKEGLVFVSTRTKGENKDRWINDNYMDLYYAALLPDSSFGQPKLFAEELKTALHEGPCTFTNNQQTIYFTRNDLFKGKRGKSNDGTTKLNLYRANWVDGKWTEEEPLPFNEPNTNQAHPALTNNGRILVFSSNAKGGFGGMDLWASRLENGTWGKPVNLGKEINTSGDEVFPFIHEDGTLYFSSNGWSSLGGLDVFMATQIYNHPDSLWEFPFNVGAPLNSSYDDFGLVMNAKKTSGYYASSRKGGQDDIYRFDVEVALDQIVPLPTKTIDICVYDDATRLRLGQAKVTVQRDADFTTDSIVSITGAYGHTLCQFSLGEPYFITVERAGYIGVADYFIMPKDTNVLEEYCIGLSPDPQFVEAQENVAMEEKRKEYSTTIIPPVNYTYDPAVPLLPLHIKGQVLDKKWGNPLPKTSVILLNRCTGKQLVMEVAANGEFGFPLECGCEYVLKSKKNLFKSAYHIISLMDDTVCNKAMNLNLVMSPTVDKSKETSLSWEKVKQGDVIEIEGIFYDYDKWNIREDAAQGLDNLVQVMKDNPSIEIELSSHTDNRGSAGYNQVLSEKRAKTARNYLIQAGIEAFRISAIGYGEKKLKNTCNICSESDHQENRRTEVLITKM